MFLNFNISLTLLYKKQLYICTQQTKTNIMKLKFTDYLMAFILMLSILTVTLLILNNF